MDDRRHCISACFVYVSATCYRLDSSLITTMQRLLIYRHFTKDQHRESLVTFNSETAHCTHQYRIETVVPSSSSPIRQPLH